MYTSLSDVDVVTSQGEVLTLSLLDSGNGYLIENIDGLDPVRANIVSSSFANMDGVQYQSSSLDSRNIIITVGLEPDWVNSTVKSLRKNLYSIFQLKSFVELRFSRPDEPTVWISGIVETIDTPMFTKEPRVVISILCPRPDFLSRDTQTFLGTTVPSPTGTAIEIDNEGSSDAGLVFRMDVNRSISGFTLWIDPVGGVASGLTVTYQLLAGDTLEIDTNRGYKRATLTRGGVNTSIIHAISSQSTWLTLPHGISNARAVVAGAGIPIRISFSERFGGL